MGQHGHADAHAHAVDRRDQRFTKRGELSQEARKLVGVAAAVHHALHLGQVLSGREGPSRAGEQDNRNARVLLGLFEALVHGFIQDVVERVHELGAVENQLADPANVFDAEFHTRGSLLLGIVRQRGMIGNTICDGRVSS